MMDLLAGIASCLREPIAACRDLDVELDFLGRALVGLTGLGLYVGLGVVWVRRLTLRYLGRTT